ncbi:PIG-L deacetylase family protein [Telluria beijingensis]|uniref:PIG-L deacetylase family protein n=1 Tax=Telluria beijingensis TaxID=3068633 RepID=UPI00279592B8|nr:PIG-L family deacetylase [Massilia sp. REN29]
MDAVSRSRHIAGAGSTARAWALDAALNAVPFCSLDAIIPPGRRVVVVAPHPDDEILACGALLHLLALRGDTPLIVAVTDGEASHPGSSDWPPERLRLARANETVAALACLGIDAPRMVRLGIPDGGVGGAERELASRLAPLFAQDDIVITTWRHDGHPDHEACARACMVTSRQAGARLLQAPVWGWHWSAPGDGCLPLAQARRLPLPASAVAKKRAALACFTSQVEPDASSGAAPILPGFAIERVLHPFELYLDDHG